MTLQEFRTLAARMYEEIPARFREGVEGVLVEPGSRGHPNLPGIFTMGECVSESWPDGVGEGAALSRIVLYYGSFRELARGDPAFDWKEELWETILHELLHHREYAAHEEGLEVLDWAIDQNFRRLAGRPFDPDFPRAIPPDPDGAVRLESEIFVETSARPRDRESRFWWRDAAYTVRLPPGDRAAFVTVRNLANGRLCVVVRRRRPWWRRLLGGQAGPVELERRALPAPTG
ncbi:MAG: hypothetical protein ACE5JR_00950 [Gemmatimonadota bacterium]